MPDFGILKGDSSRIGTETTPFHDGHVYFTPNDGSLYIDSQDGDSQNRIKINPKESSEYTYDNMDSGLEATNVQDAIDEVAGKSRLHVGTSTPSDTNILWVDTSAGGVIKYYNGSSWALVPSVWT